MVDDNVKGRSAPQISTEIHPPMTPMYTDGYLKTLCLPITGTGGTADIGE